MFTDKLEPIISNLDTTISEKDIIKKGIGTVNWSWTDEERSLLKATPKINPFFSAQFQRIGYATYYRQE